MQEKSNKIKKEKLIRLDKFLSSQNLGSRKDVTRLIKKGFVTIDSEVIKKADMKLSPLCSEVKVAGKTIDYKENVYIMMNKPAGVLSATEDKRKTVLDILPTELSFRGLFPAGRLDKDTTGLLIITDDGNFAHEMLSPKKHIYKKYHAITERPISENDIKLFESGITYGDRKYSPAKLWKETVDGLELAAVLIREGKFHQVKRMFEATENKVLKLKRVQIGGLKLDESLAEGESRLITDYEKCLIFSEQNKLNF